MQSLGTEKRTTPIFNLLHKGGFSVQKALFWKKHQITRKDGKMKGNLLFNVKLDLKIITLKWLCSL